MSAAATRTLWKVSIEEGRFASMRMWEGLFTNERAAKSFIRRFEAAVEQRYSDISIEEVEAYKTGERAISDAQWPFEELKYA